MENIQTKSGLNTTDFVSIIDNKRTELYILENSNGSEMTVCNYGAKIVSLMVPDKNGKMIDIVLGHQNIADYLTSEEPYFGAICGRYGNRIAKGNFVLDGKEYQLAINNGPNSLHGGLKGFNSVVWDAKQIDKQTIELIYLSPDKEEGFPGELKTKVTYHLTNDDAVEITYKATTNKPTVLNLTNHSYFNLSGSGNSSICNHILEINADYYLPTDETAIPYGAKESVHNTPMDFTKPEEVGKRINEPFQQLIYGKGYDHTYIINKKTENELAFCARCSSPLTGITMEVYTTQPGVQLYTGNWMTGNFEGKKGQFYPARAALCLETQHFPDSPNKPDYPTTVLGPKETFSSKTIYKFTTEKRI